jgi:hypothetical protein
VVALVSRTWELASVGYGWGLFVGRIIQGDDMT